MIYLKKKHGKQAQLPLSSSQKLHVAWNTLTYLWSMMYLWEGLKTHVILQFVAMHNLNMSAWYFPYKLSLGKGGT